MMNWFGQDWGAPVCKTSPRCDVPVGELCLTCRHPIMEDDQGIVMPSYTGDGTDDEWRPVPMHLDCFLETILPFRKPNP